ncbi:MAG TPA: phosphoribosyltransferase family protein [Thermoanaerobaculia bacterium]|nr:phosphoribosyltransferase family protein [Thermoanaerobaculia bacterium]
MEWTDAWGEYRGGLELLLRALKFEGHDFLASALATLLAAVPSLHKPDAPGLDCVAAVPMHSRKLRHRGYNQADLLARHLARRVGVPYEPRMLVKQLDGVPQSTLPREERRRNVRRAFAGSPKAKGKRILLVDDICTTGETLRACSYALLNENAASVCAIVVARA